MPARTGQQYIKGSRSARSGSRGERVRDVTTHPGLAGGARAIAQLYDMQHDPRLAPTVMTYASPSSGERGRPLVRHAADQGGAGDPHAR